MNETKHFINGVEIRPKNADSIGFKMDWTGDPREAELTVSSIVLETKALSVVKEHIENGVGFFEGIPYTVEIDGLSLDYYIDLTQAPTFSDHFVEVNIKRRKAIDWFKQQADGLSFELLNKKAPIQNMFNIKYIIVRDNQGELLIMLAITTYSLTQALIDAALKLQAGIADFAATLPPLPANIGAFIAALIMLAARIIYFIALVIALINLIQQIMEIIFPKVRFFLASKVKELLSQGCNELGYQFESTLLDSYSNLTILPVPMQDDNNSIFDNLIGIQSQSYTKGYPTAHDTTQTLGRLFDAVESTLNAKTRIINNGGTVKTEIRDFWYDLNGVQITNTLNLQDKRVNAHTYNFEEAWKRYFMHYQIDPTDSHTMDKILSADCEYSTEPVTVQNADLVLIKGLVEINIPFALGIRKEVLNFVEKIALALAQFADFIINTFGGNSNLAGLINGRIGVLQISQQYFTTTKLLWAINGKQPSNYLDIIGANAIYQNLHTINQVKENFKRIATSTIKFAGQSFINLLNNNVVEDQFGDQLELKTFEWINESKTAEITYTEDSDEANNIETILIDG